MKRRGTFLVWVLTIICAALGMSCSKGPSPEVTQQPSARATSTATPNPGPAAVPPPPAAVATPPFTASTEGIGTADGEQSGTKAVITDLKRGGGMLTLKFTIYNNSGAEFSTGSRFNADGYKENGGRSFSAIHLIDGVSKKKYFVVADSDGSCLCSEHVDDIKANTQMSLWAKFPAPPDEVRKITVQIPHFIPVDDVPIR